MPHTDGLAVVEALLFVSPDPLTIGKISEITGIEAGAVREIVNELEAKLEERKSGLMVREIAGGIGLYTRPEVSNYVGRLIKSQYNPRLTRAALETLAIVAYLQPVSRSVVSEIRGVESQGVMKTLEERGMIEPVGRGDPPGYPVLYGTTRRFLERFGLKNLDELPDIGSFAPDEETISKIRRVFSMEMAVDERLDRERKAPEGSEDFGRSRDSLEENLREAD